MPGIRRPGRLLRIALCASLLAAPAPAADAVDASTLKGKVLLGYQGWFRCPGGGAMGSNWSHWFSGAPAADSLVVDMYPDLREFDPDELCAIPGMTLGDRPAVLFSSGNSKTVERHFRWMQHYGLDGVLLQRFLTAIPGQRAAGDVVLKNVMAAAARSGRVFAIEYDVSGAGAANLADVLKEDWRYLVETLKVTEHPNYLHHNGKPVFSIWGIGFTGNHPPDDPAAARDIVQWFQSTAGVAYMGGTPSYWRALSNDARPDPGWAGVYQSMDIIQPWTVGRYADLDGAGRWLANQIQPDLARTAQNSQLYMPVIFPGFSWYNLKHATQNAPLNQIPRLKGEFLWRQAYNARMAGAEMLKIAMFDEVNEATAIFKTSARPQDAPDQGAWLSLDADGFLLPSDWYLRLAGEITRGFHGLAPLPAEMPVQPGPPWTPDGAGPNLAITSAASPDIQALAPESLASARGAGLSATPQIAPMPLPLSLGETGVTLIDSTGAALAAHLISASPDQVNFQLPAAAANGPAALLVTSGGAPVAVGGTNVATVAPGLFSAGADGQGVASAFITLQHPGGASSSSLAFVCLPGGICTSLPIDLGDEGDQAFVTLYGTGIRGRSSLAGVSCTIGGIDAPVRAAQPHDSYPGLDEIVVLLPRTLAGAGEVGVVLNVDGATANVVTLNFR
jgi:uncharacterized protein (TIGR03437 family)